jgi:mannosylglycerate synthase
MITRPLFAKLFPETVLPLIDQPLGGELLIAKKAAQTLGADPLVTSRSDWGIDTALTFSSINNGFSIYETYIPQGKIHKLYGALTDIKTMLVECFETVHTLVDLSPGSDSRHMADRAARAPEAVAAETAYDTVSTLALIPTTWNAKQRALLDLFPPRVRDGMLAAAGGQVSFMDERDWGDVLDVLLNQYVIGDDDWREMLFQLWIVRVLAYTQVIAPLGHQRAMGYLRATIDSYIQTAQFGR